MADGNGFEPVTFSEAEYREYFDTPGDQAPRSRRRIGRQARIVAVVAAVAMLAGTVTVLATAIRDFASINEPDEIRDHALARIAESQWGWLATDVVVAQIPEPRIGARVSNNPPDGIITIDRRNWNGARLDRLVDHELGHLLDFAIGADATGQRRGGLASEAWAECAAVAAGTRPLDRKAGHDRYHCFADELEIYEQTIAGLTEVCRQWGPVECRPVATLRE